jgi:hypothetical protein
MTFYHVVSMPKPVACDVSGNTNNEVKKKPKNILLEQFPNPITKS